MSLETVQLAASHPCPSTDNLPATLAAEVRALRAAAGASVREVS